MIAVGAMIIVLSFCGIMNGDKWAEYGWGKENVLAHDEDYEKMGLYHHVPLGAMAIGIFVSKHSSNVHVSTFCYCDYCSRYGHFNW